jgi:HlyD family secretion protein
MVVQPLDTAVIRSIEVSVGERVKQGQLLATLDPTFVHSDIKQLQVTKASLEAKIQRLQAEVAGKAIHTNQGSIGAMLQLQISLWQQRDAQHRANLQRLKQKLSQLQASLQSNLQDQQSTADLHTNATAIETMYRVLFEQDQGSRLNWLTAQKDSLRLVAQMDSLRGREQEIYRAIETAETEMQVYISGRQSEITQELVIAVRQLEELQQQLHKAQHRSALVELTAVEDGVVLEVAKLSKGSVVKAAEPLITLVPLSNALMAEVDIKARDIGRIHVGQMVRIKLDAWPFQRYGTLQGKVAVISADAFVGNNGSVDGDAVSDGQMVYRARIEITDTHLRYVPENFSLIPGLTLGAEINVGTRRAIRYLFDPLVRVLDETMREP